MVQHRSPARMLPGDVPCRSASGPRREMEETNVRVIAEYGPAARSTPQRSTAPTPLVDVRPMLPRWCYAAALVVGIPVLFISPAGKDSEDLVRMERLAPKIER